MDLSCPESTLSRRGLLTLALAAPVTSALSGCGTIMHPERRGQGRSGPLDWTVVALDGIGLLLFFIPGVVAFAVDYYNGTLFLPSEHANGSRHLRDVRLSQTRPTREELEAALERELGRPVSLADTRLRTRKLRTVQEFWRRRDELSQDPAAKA